MKIKEFKQMHIESGDLLIFNVNEFGEAARARLCRSLTSILHDKNVGIVFVNDVHDSVAIQKNVMKGIEKKIAEKQGLTDDTLNVSFDTKGK